MSIEFVGWYEAQAPKIRHSEDPFDRAVDGDQVSKEMAEHFGFRYISEAVNVWLYVTKYVEPHTDAGGLCLVYLHRGRGKLCVLKKGRLYERRLYPGDVVMFNDRCKHFWLSDKPCTLLCCNVHRKNS